MDRHTLSHFCSSVRMLVLFSVWSSASEWLWYNLSRHLVIADSLVNVYISTALIVIAEGMKVTAAAMYRGCFGVVMLVPCLQ